MDLRQMEYLGAVQEHGGFTAAARALHVAQPAVSHAIGRLESELGLELVDRGARRLTEAGLAVAARGSRARSELRAAREEVEAIRGVRTGSLRLGAIHWMAPFDLAAVLARFRARRAGVSLTLKEDDAPKMLDDLLAGDLDLVIHHRSRETDRDATERAVLVAEPISVAVARDDPWVGRRRITLRQLTQRDLVAFRAESAYRRAIDEVARDRGVSLRPTLESSDMMAVADLVARGLGVALLPDSLIARRRDLVRIATDRLVREVVLVWRTDHRPAPAARALRDLLVASVAAPPSDDAREALS